MGNSVKQITSIAMDGVALASLLRSILYTGTGRGPYLSYSHINCCVF